MQKHKLILLSLFLLISIAGCKNPETTFQVETLQYSRDAYGEKLYGFWLGQCIANWTGLITEMDKIGIPTKEGKGEGFYTREDWGKPDQPNIWGSNNYSPIIDFIFAKEDSIWGADDDTDIEYIYQELLLKHQTTQLSPEQIRQGWLDHILEEEENYLWVSNQQAFDLMRKGILPPQTSDPTLNSQFEMIDAQLTTEIFGLFAPGRPDIALEMAHLPIRTTAQENAAWISEFYVIMYSLAGLETAHPSLKEKTKWMAMEARKRLPEDSYSAKMFDFVKGNYEAGLPWEATRDALHEKYQILQEDGYDLATREEYCHGCAAAGINFGASIISLLYGEGDLKETIKIGALCGWDSDNPTATWGGMLGFMYGKEGVEKAFGRKFSNKFWIHRTRKGFPNDGIDTFENMADKGLQILDRVMQERMGGKLENGVWSVEKSALQIIPAK
ncbi:ADP-ribosylglycohydrolase [Algoriphagus boseongensis]|uniref:ADP-ribosylglycohydrolase n=1 Tax=Algoriphagus boseongensis TaxID=1442587 RepID=A0A4R6T3Z8_9BACT|nr:ADP-ribosylglycohydrolase family protein [Algoriphagus boseongensis]TDQ16387.1 ADP-ribosylglycohydrolase [Algoriphagus boseongensis]